MIAQVAAKLAEAIDEHRERPIGLLSLFLTAFLLARRLPSASDVWFYIYQVSYFLPMVALLFTRRRWQDSALLGWLLLYYVIVGLDFLPSSQWGLDLMLSPGHAPGPPA